MYTLDDPTLALILRFIGREQAINFRDEVFLREQLRAIQDHLDSFPPEERQARAFEWIETYASEYRDSWAQRVVDETFFSQRCGDCPLAASGSTENCEIHERWLELLHRYIGNEISARAYAEDSLALLAEHKENLRVPPALLGERS